MRGNQTSASSAPSAPLIRTISQLIAEKLLVEVDSPEDDLLATGVLDSLTLIELLVHMEEHFGMRIPLDEIQLEDVRSVQSLARLVESKTADAVAGDRR
jgi:methoxymalonate biosynthesis acyl carrier protein